MILQTIDTSTGKKHRHLVTFSEQEPIATTQEGQPIPRVEGFTSVGPDGHTHPVSFDPMLGEIELLPSGATIHSHEVDELPVGEVEDTELDKTDAEVVSYIQDLYKEVEAYEKDSRVQGDESYRFYHGEQWDKGDKSSLEAEGRAALTINEIAPKVDLITGFQRQNRTDVRLFPIEEGDSRTASILTTVIKNITDRNNFNQVESNVFLDTVVPGRGLYNVYVSYEKDLLGSIIVERLGWKDAYLAPHSNQDLTDCEYIVKTKMFAKSKLVRMYPEKKEEIEQMYGLVDALIGPLSDHPGHQYDFPDNLNRISLSDNFDTLKKTIKVYECWLREYKTAYTVANMDTGFVKVYNQLSNKDMKTIEKMGFEVIRRTYCQMRVIKIAGNVLLSNELEDTEYFPIIPVYAKTSDNGFYGLVNPVKDCQREINKRTSQSIDIINKMSSYGYFYDQNTFLDVTEENNFRRNSSQPGFCIKVADLAKQPQQTQGIKMPIEVVSALELASTKMRQILNISPEAQGFAQREISSVALIETRRSTMTALEFLFDNMAQAKKLMTKVILSHLTKVYNAERILRILNNKNPSTQNQADENAINEQMVAELLVNADVDKFDVAIDVSPQSATIRSANFALILQMMQMGIQMDPSLIIELSDLPDKDKILGKLNEVAEAARADSKMKSDTEINKVIASKTGVDPRQATSQAGSPPIPQSGSPIGVAG